ncbi:MAG TPA: hypothetical protein VJ901_15130 [Thermoanaerobaculia bacterium]|nr:hypothetical protein [Thermoanaerobaculia bacterium]
MATTSDDNKPNDSDLGGDYARDNHRGGFGDDYAREGDLEAPKTKDSLPDIGKASE